MKFILYLCILALCTGVTFATCQHKGQKGKKSSATAIAEEVQAGKAISYRDCYRRCRNYCEGGSGDWKGCKSMDVRREYNTGGPLWGPGSFRGNRMVCTCKGYSQQHPPLVSGEMELGGGAGTGEWHITC